jgi:hypothetical protein
MISFELNNIEVMLQGTLKMSNGKISFFVFLMLKRKQDPSADITTTIF